ncbi:HNH endonuclease [Mucilaginibacter aquariorum]|uniref:HNH endonuclease n=1 Tax=Mucilaginibacter aquariorum TaxID=2967225 RepID=A0ABT1T1X3_9SPHI|nr:HNH endonuclease signature motif containing protein [Mucilaginibacter aquariorum]MCQ6958601.1 HNH endonuclease [Mucilaginibacter aquariorum]
MEWVDAIIKALTDLDGYASEPEILKKIAERQYRDYGRSQTPQRSLNYYLNQKLKDRVRKIDNNWVLLKNPSVYVVNDAQKKADTIKGIIELDKRFANQIPEIRQRISSYIERGAIADKVKSLADFKCLICIAQNLNPYSFVKNNGDPYVEAHHVEHVSTLKTGVLSINNIITVCPNHHRQLHFGRSVLFAQTDSHFTFEIDGVKMNVQKIIIYDNE